MIIKATFSDNDFTHVLEQFFKHFQFNLGYSAVDGIPNKLTTENLFSDLGDTLKSVLSILDHTNDEPLDIPELEDTVGKEKMGLRIKESFEYRQFNTLYHKDKLTEKDKKFIINYVREKIILFIKLNTFVKDENKDYLEKCIVLSLPSMVKDTWENGESIYYFVGSDVSVVV